MAQHDLVASVREGSRWLHNPPSGEDFAKWFYANVKIHEGLEHGDYVNGIALIPNTEKIKLTREDAEGRAAIVETQRLSFSPYPQVETRVRYFWDYCAQNGYLGEIEEVPVREQKANLPEGVAIMVVTAANGTAHTFVAASYRVRVYERDVRTGGKGKLVMAPPMGSKHVSLHGRFGPDVNAVMRAQTGAIGRALGFAGMLVVPGTGVSTAEDMQDYIANPSVGGPEPTLPVNAPESAVAAVATEEPQTASGQPLSEVIAGYVETLRDHHPDTWEQVAQWATERDLDLDNVPAASERAVERQLRRKLEAASK